MQTKILQKELKEIIAKLGWSQKRLAREIYIQEVDDNDDNFERERTEIKKFEERIKKDLSRDTTKPKRLSHYLEIIARHPDFDKLDIIIPRYHSAGILSDELEAGMIKISQTIFES